MKDPKNFYDSQLITYNSKLKTASRKLSISSFFRLLVFMITAFLIYYYFGNASAVIAVLLVGVAVFIFLVSRHTDLKYEVNKYRELLRINRTELKILGRDYQDLVTGEEFDDPLHPFSQDMDLFGKGSFFQYLNRTALTEGRKRLAALLLSNDIQKINTKQEAVKELAKLADWRQNFSALAILVKTELGTGRIVQWLKTYKSFVPHTMRWLPWVFSACSGGVIAAFFLDLIGGIALTLWFFLGLLITGFYLKRINLLSESVSKAQKTFHQYYQLLAMIESTAFSSELLKKKRDLIITEEQQASKILKKFSRAIDSLDQRNNMIFGIFGNGFLLWDLRQSYRIEKWMASNTERVEKWFEVIQFLDAYNSLGNFAFNHPDYVFPEIDPYSFVTETIQLSHPLLNPEKRVANDFSIGKEQFFIITGANMAGKSTFLRTVGLQILMANVGLPVCARSCRYSPIKLISSMRSSDSLTDDESYFFSELKQLKFIVEAIESDRYFIILDEILKGTNSTDKAKGSRKFIEKLVRARSNGIIATHDLSLCEVSEDLPQVKNYYFDAEIINDQLHFDYTFKKGVCQNMNASFLLKKMGIVD